MCTPTAAHAAQGRPLERLDGPSRIETAVAIAGAAFPDGADEVYLATATTGPDAVVAGALTGVPILLVPGDGQVPDAVHTEIARLDPDRVVAIGGSAVVSEGPTASWRSGVRPRCAT